MMRTVLGRTVLNIRNFPHVPVTSHQDSSLTLGTTIEHEIWVGTQIKPYHRARQRRETGGKTSVVELSRIMNVEMQ